MENRNKLAIFDLDGTLFDTKNVNFTAYKEAIKRCGLTTNIDYQYYCDFCNGNNYKVFLPQIVPGITNEQMEEVHNIKKQLYFGKLKYARKNHHLFYMIQLMKAEYVIALVTTASRKNVNDILHNFNVTEYFEMVIAQEDVAKTKPDPECFIKAINTAGVSAENTIIFEDSAVGLEAAEKSGAKYMKVYGYN